MATDLALSRARKDALKELFGNAVNVLNAHCGDKVTVQEVLAAIEEVRFALTEAWLQANYKPKV